MSVSWFGSSSYSNVVEGMCLAHLVFDKMANFFGTALATLKIVLY